MNAQTVFPLIAKLGMNNNQCVYKRIQESRGFLFKIDGSLIDSAHSTNRLGSPPHTH